MAYEDIVRVEVDVPNEMFDKVKEARELIDRLSRIMSDLRVSGMTVRATSAEKTSSAATDEEK